MRPDPDAYRCAGRNTIFLGLTAPEATRATESRSSTHSTSAHSRRARAGRARYGGAANYRHDRLAIALEPRLQRRRLRRPFGAPLVRIDSALNVDPSTDAGRTGDQQSRLFSN